MSEEQAKYNMTIQVKLDSETFGMVINDIPLKISVEYDSNQFCIQDKDGKVLIMEDLTDTDKVVSTSDAMYKAICFVREHIKTLPITINKEAII